MLIMTETVYKVPPENQKLFFNEGLHRSMIWVLDKYIQTMRKVPITSGAYNGKYLAPTFENTDLGEQKTSFTALTNLGNAAILAANEIIKQHSEDKPLVDAMYNVIYYVGVATTATSDGQSMHLPDVSQYW